MDFATHGATPASACLCQGWAAMSWKRPEKRRVRAIRDRLRRMYGRPVNHPHGDPVHEMVKTIRALQEVTGGFGVVLGFAHDWANPEATLRSWNLFARYVIPEINGHTRNLKASAEYLAANKVELMAGLQRAILGVGALHPDLPAPGLGQQQRARGVALRLLAGAQVGDRIEGLPDIGIADRIAVVVDQLCLDHVGHRATVETGRDRVVGPEAARRERIDLDAVDIGPGRIGRIRSRPRAAARGIDQLDLRVAYKHGYTGSKVERLPSYWAS